MLPDPTFYSLVLESAPDDVRYVGQATDLQDRLWRHHAHAKARFSSYDGDDGLGGLIREALGSGDRLVISEYVDDEGEPFASEEEARQHAIDAGHDLFNQVAGGGGRGLLEYPDEVVPLLGVVPDEEIAEELRSLGLDACRSTVQRRRRALSIPGRPGKIREDERVAIDALLARFRVAVREEVNGGEDEDGEDS